MIALLLKTILALFFLIAITVVGLLINSHFTTEHRITVALEKSFLPKNITINDRTDWDYTNQICFDVTEQSDARSDAIRKVIMVRGDIDGGSWWVDPNEYRSMKQCESDFLRG